MNAFVIGGSGGIGKAISLRLAENGYNLLIHGGKNLRGLEETCELARQKNVHVQSMSHEFSTISEFINALPTRFSPDILIIALGPLFEGSLAETLTKSWQAIIDINLGLPGALISHYAPAMAERGFGRIVLFGGTNTDQIRGYTEVAAYSAAKTGLGVIAKSVAKEFGSKNVTCNVLCPGYVLTEYYTYEMEEQAIRRMPGHKLQSTENMVNMVFSIIIGSENGLNGAILSCAYGM